MKKVVFTITKQGEVFIQAQGYRGQECLKSPKVQKLLDLLKKEGNIERLETLQAQTQELLQEESQW